MKPLADLVINNNFCVVGNSPSEVGSGNGPLIDSYDVVIRFKNYDLSEEYVGDYGKKTDVWVTPFNLTQFYRDPSEYQAICCCIPLNKNKWKRRFRGNNIDYILKEKYEEVLEYIPNGVFEEVWDLYENGQPSSGMTTLYWIYKLTGKIERGRIFGFSIFDPKEPHHYFQSKEDDKLTMRWRTSTPTTHPRSIEKKVYGKITKKE